MTVRSTPRRLRAARLSPSGSLVALFVIPLLAVGLLVAAPPAAARGGGHPAALPAQPLPAPAPFPDADEARVEALLAEMTLKEKVGQMTQLELGMVTSGEDAEVEIDADELHKAVVEYGVGSLLNVTQQGLPVETWHELLRAIQEAAAETRLGIPVVYGIDSIHGANYVTGATLFPQPLGMAATWNPELMLEASRITAAETRAAGLPWNFSPVLDVGRQPLWPRFYETFGEDVYLSRVMGVASVRGYQGDDPADPRRVAACLKHYVGYSAPVTGHDRTPALLPEVTLREYFFPPFVDGVEAGALSVMINSGEVNGIPGHVNRWLLTDVLRGEMGFEGVAVSDWEDIKKLVNIHRVAASEKEATRQAVLAGVDMSMVPSDYSFPDLLLELAREGAVPESRVDEAVRRILRMKLALGLFDDPLAGIGSGVEVGSDEHWQASLRAARESLTLLENRRGDDGAPALPLAAGARLLVTGPTCDSRVALNNGWSMTWQGDREELHSPEHPTILGALRRHPGVEMVTWVPGSEFDAAIATPGEGAEAAVAAAADADVAVICLGEMSYTETPGNIDDLALPGPQVELARAVAATGTPTVVVLVEGRPRIVGDAVADAAAVLLAYNPGPQGGRAVADVLFGDAEPGGRLPFTYPRHPNALRTYDHKAFEAQDTSFGFTAFKPQWHFGHGLSYTRFEYADLAVTPTRVTAGDEEVEVAVTVRNAGERAGSEVVMLFLSDLVASVTPPVKRLKRFAKVWLEPGESRRVAFRLDGDDLAFVGAEHRWIVEPGEFKVRVGGLTADLRLAEPPADPAVEHAEAVPAAAREEGR